MLTEKETAELARSEASLHRWTHADDDEVDSEAYEELLARVVELREKRDGITK